MAKEAGIAHQAMNIKAGISVKQHEIWVQGSIAVESCDTGYWSIKCLFSYLCQAPPLAPLVLDNEQAFLNAFHFMGWAVN